MKQKKIKKKIWRTLDELWRKAHISVMAGKMWLKFGMECVLPWRQKWCSSVQILSSYRSVEAVFCWFLYNTYLSVAHLYWLYLVARLSIMCLDKWACFLMVWNKSNSYGVTKWKQCWNMCTLIEQALQDKTFFLERIYQDLNQILWKLKP